VTNSSSSGTVNLIDTLTANPRVGGLIGYNQNSAITSSSSSATVNVNTTTTTNGITVYAGGLTGFIVAPTSFAGNFSTGSVNTATPSLGTLYLGALSGGAHQSTVTNSYSTANISVSGSQFVLEMGMIGYDFLSDYSGLFSTGTYSVNTTVVALWVAGMLGKVHGFGHSISNSYSMVTISVQSGTPSNSGNISGFADVENTNNVITSCYSASPSMPSSSGAASIWGFAEAFSTLSIVNSYLYDNAGTPSQTYAGLTSYTTASQMQTQSNFPGFTFGTNPQNWKMPSANPLSPGGLLSPVLYWQCGSNGIVCP
jgi:hypothetical protein